MVTNNDCNYQPTQYNVQTGGASGALNNVSPSATSGVPVISQGSSSQPIFGTAVVAGGGTGNTTFTAYSVIAAGTTATGAFQNISGVGTTNQVLTSNGAGALPTWQSVSALAFSVNHQIFTSTGTYTPTAGMAYCDIICLGGGGGSGGCQITGVGNVAASVGGSAGEYAQGIFSAASIGASKAVTIGAAGAAGVGAAAGGAGGTTSVGVLITAVGGVGGAAGGAGTSPAAPGVVGGTGGSGGDFRTPGFSSSLAWGNFSITQILPSNGASSQYGSGGLAATGGSSTVGGAGLGYGSGGGGSLLYQSQAAINGAAGAKGIVIITEYIT